MSEQLLPRADNRGKLTRPVRVEGEESPAEAGVSFAEVEAGAYADLAARPLSFYGNGRARGRESIERYKAANAAKAEPATAAAPDGPKKPTYADLSTEQLESIVSSAQDVLTARWAADAAQYAAYEDEDEEVAS
jgi:hypothetical protein